MTREESDDGPLSRALRAAGAIPLLAPTVEIVALHEPQGRRELLPSLHEFDWLIVTSPRTVALLSEVGVFRASRPTGLRIAAAGEQTAAALAKEGWHADRVPERAGAEPLLRALLEERTCDSAAPGPVLFPASAQAGTTLPDGLTRAGFEVHRLDLYTPRPRVQDPVWWTERTREGLDALTFTSPSAVDGLVRGVNDSTLRSLLLCLPAAVQGPTTASAAREAGWTDVVEARPRSFDGLVASLGAWFTAASDSTPTPDPLPA